MGESCPGARWEPYLVPARGHEEAGTYRLRFVTEDGWELLRAGELIAGHDGYDAQEVCAAQEWAAAELLDGHGVRVMGWTTHAEAGSAEHVVTVAETGEAEPMSMPCRP